MKTPTRLSKKVAANDYKTNILSGPALRDGQEAENRIFQAL